MRISEAPILVDTPEAYRPIITVGQRMLDDVPTMMGALAPREGFNVDLLVTEERLHGVQVGDDPEAFLLAHNRLVSDYAAYLADIFPGVLNSTIDGLAAYMSKGSEPEFARWQSILRGRAAECSGIYASDHLAGTRDRGEMRPFSRSVLINSIFAFLDPQEARPLIEQTYLPHEIIHLLSISAVRPGAYDVGFGFVAQPARIGVATFHPVSTEGNMMEPHAVWANEAVAEDLRERALGAPHGVGYGRPVALLRALKSFDTTLEATVDGTAIGAERPAAVVEKIESMLGPLSIEHLGPLMKRGWDAEKRLVVNLYDDETFIREVVALARPGIGPKIEAVLRRSIAHTKEVPQLPPHINSYH